MAVWCKEQNQELGSEIYHVIDWPPVKEATKAPQIVVEEPLVVEAPRTKPKPVKPAIEPEEPRPIVSEPVGLSMIEQFVAERTLGLDTGNAVCKNDFKPVSEGDKNVATRLRDRGLMGTKGSGFYLTVAGFTALNEKRKLHFGVVG